MNAREEILDRLRLHETTDVVHPGPFADGLVYENPASQFAATLEGVGGRCESVTSRENANEILASVPEYAAAAKTCTLVPGIGESTFELSAVADPHALEDVDFAILPGELAVAENAAVWVTTDDVCHRTLHFLVQHLALVVPRSQIVSNLHEAYKQIEVGRNPFATWISGPSKTADIEQSLVKGAHGSRTLIVLLIDD